MSDFLKTGVCAVTLLCASCAPSTLESAGGEREGALWKECRTKTVTMDQPPGATVTTVCNGHQLVAEIRWRDYSAGLDGAVTTWYGDMGSPPPKFVVDSLKLSVDGTPVPIPRSQYRNLCSQVEREDLGRGELSFHQKGKSVRLVVDLGDGGESWSAVAMIDPAAKRIISFEMEDGVAVWDEVEPSEEALEAYRRLKGS